MITPHTAIAPYLISNSDSVSSIDSGSSPHKMGTFTEINRTSLKRRSVTSTNLEPVFKQSINHELRTRRHMHCNLDQYKELMNGAAGHDANAIISPSKVGVNGAKAVANYAIAITHQSGLPKRTRPPSRDARIVVRTG